MVTPNCIIIFETFFEFCLSYKTQSAIRFNCSIFRIICVLSAGKNLKQKSNIITVIDIFTLFLKTNTATVDATGQFWTFWLFYYKYSNASGVGIRRLEHIASGILYYPGAWDRETFARMYRGGLCWQQPATVGK